MGHCPTSLAAGSGGRGPPQPRPPPRTKAQRSSKQLKRAQGHYWAARLHSLPVPPKGPAASAPHPPAGHLARELALVALVGVMRLALVPLTLPAVVV